MTGAAMQRSLRRVSIDLLRPDRRGFADERQPRETAVPSPALGGYTGPMVRTRTWWRRFGAALAALVLAVLAFGPGVDRLVCGGEGAMAAAAAEASAAFASADHPAHSHDDLGACVHGHCHHAASYAPAETAEAAEPAVLRHRHGLRRVRVATSDPKFGLLRPPSG